MASRIHRIRIEAEGSSAAAVEGEFALAIARIQRALGTEMVVGSQVIELNDDRRPTSAVELLEGTGHPMRGVSDPLSPWREGWYFGRITIFAAVEPVIAGPDFVPASELAYEAEQAARAPVSGGAPAA
jgi:hypothetical protein